MNRQGISPLRQSLFLLRDDAVIVDDPQPVVFSDRCVLFQAVTFEISMTVSRINVLPVSIT